MTAIPTIRTRLNSKTIGWSLTLGVGLVFLVLAGRPYGQQANYTFVIADAILHGHLGLDNGPSWLNELVPMGGRFYSVFPLGAVLSVLPFSLLVSLRLLGDYPTDWVVALVAAGCTGLAYWYTYARRDLTQPNRVLLALWLVGGTWFMTNLLFSGAWQIALGFAVLGELAGIHRGAAPAGVSWVGLCYRLWQPHRTITSGADTGVAAHPFRRTTAAANRPLAADRPQALSLLRRPPPLGLSYTVV
jgi:hypothetical protein